MVLREEVGELRKLVSGIEAMVSKMEGKVDNVGKVEMNLHKQSVGNIRGEESKCE